MRYILCLLWLIFQFIFAIEDVSAQETDLRREQQMEELAEAIASNEEGSTEGSVLLEDMNFLSQHPLLINQASEEELLRYHLFNFKQIKDLIDYRTRYGGILTLKELTVIGGFSDELMNRLASLVRFDMLPDSFQLRRSKQLHQSWLFRMKTGFPVSAGFSSVKSKPPVYPGAPIGYFSRYRAEIGQRIELGLTAENDAGEELWRHSNSAGPDFVSGFFSWHGTKMIRKVVAGDFHLRFGQGVSLWSGGGVTYASDLSSLMRTGDGVRPYSSCDENNFFRGLAVQLARRPVKISLFYSDKYKDANLDRDSTNQAVITSFRTDGLHRTISEASDERDVREQVFGGYSDVRFNHWRFGLLASFQRLGLPVASKSAPYQAKSFTGNANENFSADYHCILNQLSFFGEAALSGNLRPALVNGVIWRAHPQISISWLYRYYDPSFHTFYSGAFAEGSGGKNEQGFYTAFEYYPFPHLKLGGQTDLFNFPWMTFQTISPGRGLSVALQAEVTLSSRLHIYLHTKWIRKPQKVSGSTGIPEQWDESTAKWRLHGDWKINDHFQLRSRLEYVQYQYNHLTEEGGLLFQDLIYTASSRLKGWMRIAFYATDGYNSRVYAFENDLLYYYAIPEFHGRGIRCYCNLKWQPVGMFALYLKGGYTLREGALQMGSGADATPGDHRFDVRGEIYLRF